jgi:hypothetical protein
VERSSKNAFIITTGGLHMSLIVYIAAPFKNYELALSAATVLRQEGLKPLCDWAEKAKRAKGTETLSDTPAVQSALEQNYRELGGADALLMLTEAGQGGEMFVELGWFLGRKAGPVVWVMGKDGRLVLSAFRNRVIRVADLNEAAISLRALNVHTSAADED